MEKIYGKNGITLPERLIIPKLSDEKLLWLYHSIRPIVFKEEAKYFLKELTLYELRNLSFLNDEFINPNMKFNSNNFEVVEDFPCLHLFNDYKVFRPSVLEVLVQLPNDSIKYSSVFEIIEKPKTSDDVFLYPELEAKHLHLSKVRTYKYKY